MTNFLYFSIFSAAGSAKAVNAYSLVDPADVLSSKGYSILMPMYYG
ncbi:MAG: hypothetical protein V7K50_06575 [Nostoc sp.]